MTSYVAGEPRQVQLIGHRDGLRRANQLLDCKLRCVGRTRVGVSDSAVLRSQYAGSARMAVVPSYWEVDDDFLTVDVDGPAVSHLTHQPPPLIVETVLSSSAA